MKKQQKQNDKNQTVDDQDFVLYNDQQDEREAIETLSYSGKDSYGDEGSGWEKFYG